MKATIVTLAAALMLGTPWAASVRAQDSNAPVILPDQQQGQQGDQPVKKRKKKDQVEQTQQSAPEGAEDQGDQTFKRRKKREQAEQPSDQMQPSAEDQDQQTFKKRKKREQAEQPSAEDQEQQTFKRRKKREQAEQPLDQNQPSAEDQNQPSADDQNQPIFKKSKKKQADEPVDQNQPSAEDQNQQTSKKRKKEQAEQPVDQNQPTAEDQNQPTFKKRKKERAEQPVDQTQPPSEQTTGQPQSEQPAAGNVPPEVTQFLSDSRSVKQLSDEELTARARAGHDLSRMKGLSDDVRRKLTAEGRKARQEALARAGGTAQGSQEQQGGEQPVFGQPPTGKAAKGDQTPGQGEGQGQMIPPTYQAGQLNPDKKQVQQLDGNKGSPEAENKARVFLNDKRPVDQLKDDQLRDRLEGMRGLMAGNQLSADSERELRRRLRAEREILRNRVSRKVVTEEDKGDVVPGRKLRGDTDEHKWGTWSERDVLRDRRRSEDLQEGELRRRIDIYRVAIYDDRYDDQERAYWRDMMERDRSYLRERLINDRRERERYWHDRRDRNDLNIEINIDLEQDREPPEAVFMDEIDDDDLETYLVAAPRRRIERRYTIEEIEQQPELRTAMPAIEIDNIHFGFNESFVREEEVDKLDRIAEVIEKILAAHPGEVFLIAGYTDAVGSDAYNLQLSRERAEAVKKALTTYYVVPARNLKTVGYGERYLKIPTSEEEEENRRVSLQRVTPLVGEADEAAEAE
jgi:outer membrane protein OmpA-like peptidoglycan-associated protein